MNDLRAEASNSSLLPGAMPRAVLFDAGMTLIHPSGDLLVAELAAHGAVEPVDPRHAQAALVVAAEARHLTLPPGRSGTEKVALTWATLLGIEPAVAVPACMSAIARPDLYSEIDPGALKTVRELHTTGIPLGVVSNSEGTVRDDLAAFGLLEYFDVVIDSNVVGVEKPDARAFQCALTYLNLDGTDCWYVGDGLVNDVLAAVAAGLSTGILYDRYDCFSGLPVVPRISRLDQLIDLVTVRIHVPCTDPRE